MNEQNISSQADNQNFADAIKMQAAQDIQQIENLVNSGAMTQEEGLNLVNYISKRAFDMYTQNSQTSNQKPSKETPEFFKRDGRAEVFEYLNNYDANFDDDEISKISDLVELIEKKAVERYLREIEHEKSLNSENESAKQKLRANAQNSTSEGSSNVVYTREKIGKMSGAEFTKHERAIMEQLRKGLIR
jgi:hypothetical protein